MNTLHALMQHFLRLHPKEIDLSIERIRRLLRELGDPHLSLPPVIHVAGTNGKGSTIATMEHALLRAGARVHVFNSPYITCYNEYIRLYRDGRCMPIDDAALIDILTHVDKINDERPATFFELATAAAFLAFSRVPADVILLEVGLGGRYDSTNVIDHPRLCVITPVSIDHTDFLGPRLDGIAYDKAGILKPGVEAVIAPQSEIPAEVIAREAAKVGARLIRGGIDWHVGEEAPHDAIRFEMDGRVRRHVPSALGSGFQVVNAGTAIAALARMSEFGVTDAAIDAGLASVYWPGRMERVAPAAYAARLPACAGLIFDGGHNEAAAREIVKVLQAEERKAGADAAATAPLTLVCALFANKDAEAFLGAFAGTAARVLTLDMHSSKPVHSAEYLAQTARGLGIEAHAAHTLPEAMAQVMASEGTYRVLITGSFLLLAEAYRFFDIAPWQTRDETTLQHAI